MSNTGAGVIERDWCDRHHCYTHACTSRWHIDWGTWLVVWVPFLAFAVVVLR